MRIMRDWSGRFLHFEVVVINANLLGYSQAARHGTLTPASLVQIQLPQPYANVAQLVEQLFCKQ